MTRIETICIICSALSVILSVTVVLWYRGRTKRTMRLLSDMVDAAIDGTFTESIYDESRLSALEIKMSRYLASAEVSSKNLAGEKAKIEELIADISHQTKTPIANILLYAELLGEQELPEESRDCVRALTKQAQKLRFLITSLVKLSRLETGILLLHPKQEEIGEMLENVIQQYLPRAQDKNIELRAENTAGRAFFDKKWTAEAVCNILDNALKYTKEHGSVTIRVVEYEMFGCIEIADTGPGIPEREQAKVFMRFYRTPDAGDKEGVGIGLYLARQILAEEGGYLKLTSKPGRGSVFSMYLPRMESR